ncbi:hypothetical protein GCM10009609_02800 [Pseudonocardia aurantiaca]|uniref:DUF397 domain-containing protein n=1 Tax=Pseudonocardia aurantiaca TaxID=75290 RepID=A0ABW4FDD0_9PSEU
MTAGPRTPGLAQGRWVKARRSDNASGCVEVRVDGGVYRVRDTKDLGRGPVLSLTKEEWRAFCDALLAGPDRLVQAAGLQLALRTDGGLTIRRSDGARLRFTAFEVECFLDGLRGGEFDLPSARTA